MALARGACALLVLLGITSAHVVRRQEEAAADDGPMVIVLQKALGTDTIVTCSLGTKLVGAVCVDIDECTERYNSRVLATCGENSTCTNTRGSYSCTCKAGYTGDGQTCTPAVCEVEGVLLGEGDVRVSNCTSCQCMSGDLSCTRVAGCSVQPSREGAQYMYIWYADVDTADPDFLATLDFDRNSSTYGKVLAVTPVDEEIGYANEAHHIGLSGDNRTLLAGGLFSYVSGNPDFFLFDIGEDPAKPTFLTGLEAPLSSATDDFFLLPNGHTVVSMMGGLDGGPYGRVLELDINNNIVGEWPTDPPEDLTPHGISCRPERNLMITSDYILPSSLFEGPVVSRRSMRVWDLEEKTIVRTIRIPDSESMMDLTLIPNDPLDRGYCPGQGGMLYILNTQDGTYEPVYDFDPILARSGPTNSTLKPVTQPHILRFRKDGKRAFMTMYEASKVAMLDTTDPLNPRLLRVIDLGPGAGPHYLTLSRNEDRVVVTDYFIVNSYLGGLLHMDGDRRTHVFLVDDDDFYYDPLWYHNGNFFTTGPARPHGVVVSA